MIENDEAHHVGGSPNCTDATDQRETGTLQTAISAMKPMKRKRYGVEARDVGGPLDWTNVTDLKERLRMQSAINNRNYWERKKAG